MFVLLIELYQMPCFRYPIIVYISDSRYFKLVPIVINIKCNLQQNGYILLQLATLL